MAGRITLVNSVITGALIHSIIYKWPKKLLNTLNRAVGNFIWSGCIVEKKLVVVPWSLCTNSFRQWVLGLRNTPL